MDYLLLVGVDNDDTNQNQYSIKLIDVCNSIVLLRRVKYDFLYLLLDITCYYYEKKQQRKYIFLCKQLLNKPFLTKFNANKTWINWTICCCFHCSFDLKKEYSKNIQLIRNYFYSMFELRILIDWFRVRIIGSVRQRKRKKETELAFTFYVDRDSNR